MSAHVNMRNKLLGIGEKERFIRILDAITISELDRKIMCLWYFDDKTFREIGDMLGYSESGIKKRHSKIIAKTTQLSPHYFKLPEEYL